MDKEIYLSGLRRIVNTHEVETQLFARLTSKNDSIILESGAYIVDDSYYQSKQMDYDNLADQPFTTIWLAERNRFWSTKLSSFPPRKILAYQKIDLWFITHKAKFYGNMNNIAETVASADNRYLFTSFDEKGEMKCLVIRLATLYRDVHFVDSENELRKVLDVFIDNLKDRLKHLNQQLGKD